MARPNRAGTDQGSKAMYFKIHRHITDAILLAPAWLRIDVLREAIYGLIWNYKPTKRASEEKNKFMASLRKSLVDSISNDLETWEKINEDLVLPLSMSEFIKSAAQSSKVLLTQN